MADLSQERTGAHSDSPPTAYRAIVVASSGTVINAKRLLAENDEQAIECARAMFDGRTIELWDGMRFIAHFPPVD